MTDHADHADDFGHLVHRPPAVVVAARSADEVAEAVRGATAVAARGWGHSVWGRSQVDGGVVVDLSGLRAVHDVRADRVVVDAGATWRDVLTATLPLGRTPPVLPDFLDLSVGGTLVVGGVGATTSTYGVVADTALELDVVTGAGERVTCSAARRADLFDAVRAGLAQVGIVTRATVRLVPAPESVRRAVREYPDLAALLADARRLAAEGGPDEVQGAVVPDGDGRWTYRLETAVHGDGDESFLAHRQRLDALEAALRAGGRWTYPHPWLTTFVPAAVVPDELARLDPATDLGRLGQVGLSPIRRAAVTSPLLRLPDEALCFTFNVVRLPDTDDPAGAARLVAANRATYERIRTAGGTLYPVSAFPMSSADWRAHFGPAFAGLATARRTYDPRGVLTPGLRNLSGACVEMTDGRSLPW